MSYLSKWWHCGLCRRAWFWGLVCVISTILWVPFVIGASFVMLCLTLKEKFSSGAIIKVPTHRLLNQEELKQRYHSILTGEGADEEEEDTL